MEICFCLLPILQIFEVNISLSTHMTFFFIYNKVLKVEVLDQRRMHIFHFYNDCQNDLCKYSTIVHIKTEHKAAYSSVGQRSKTNTFEIINEPHMMVKNKPCMTVNYKKQSGMKVKSRSPSLYRI